MRNEIANKATGMLRRNSQLCITSMVAILIVLPGLMPVVQAQPAHAQDATQQPTLAATSAATQGAQTIPASLVPIGPDNASHLARLARLGLGSFYAVAWSPDGSTLTVASSVGIWLYSWTHLDNPPRLLEGHTSFVSSVAFSSDGKLLASGSEDTTVRLWNVQTGHTVSTLRMNPDIGHDNSNWITSVAFSPDGKLLASDSYGGALVVWNILTGQAIAHYESSGGMVGQLYFSPDGKFLFGKGGKVWDLQTGQASDQLADEVYADDVALRPDGKLLAYGFYDGSIHLRDAQSLKRIGSLRDPKADASKTTGLNVQALAFSPDGKLLASAGLDQPVRIWDVQSGKILSAINPEHWITTLVFSPDGKLLASNDGHVWDAQSGQLVATLPGLYTVSEVAGSDVTFSPDGSLLASVTVDEVIRLWDMQSLKNVVNMEGNDANLLQIAFSPNGKQVVSVNSNGPVRLWDVRSGQNVRTFKDFGQDVTWVAFSPDGKSLATNVGNDVVIKDMESERVLATLTGHTDSVTSVAFSPDGQKLASGSADHTVRLWDVQSGQSLATLKGHSRTVRDVAFSRDGALLASGSLDGTARLWSMQSRQNLATFHNQWLIADVEVWSVTFSPDGKLLASSGQDGVIRLWDVHSHRQVTSLLRHTDTGSGVAFSPDGKLLATGGADSTVLLWGVPGA